MNTDGGNMDLRRAPVARRRLRILWATLVVVALAVVVVLTVRREPEFKGQKLSHWISQLDTDRSVILTYDSTLNPEATEAVRSIGAAGVPYLIRWIEAGLRNERYRSWVQASRPGFISVDQVDAFFDPSGKRCVDALRAFKALGELGAEGGRPLQGLAEREAWLSQLWLAAAQAGTNSIPWLLAGLQSSNLFWAGNAAQAAGELGGQGRGLVPQLMRVAVEASSDRLEKIMALRSLGKIGTPAQEVRGFLVSMMAHTNQRVADNAAFGLAFMGTGSQPAIPQLECRVRSAPADQCRMTLLALISLCGDDRVKAALRARGEALPPEASRKIVFVRETWTNAAPGQKREIFDALATLLNVQNQSQ